MESNESILITQLSDVGFCSTHSVTEQLNVSEQCGVDQPRELPSLQVMLCRAVLQQATYRGYMGEHLAEGDLSEMDHGKHFLCLTASSELHGVDLFLLFPR